MNESLEKEAFDVKKFLVKHQKFEKKINYTFKELKGLLKEAKSTYINNNALCELSSPVNIVGDIHGQFNILQRIFEVVGLPGKVRYLFLGDYVDRGPNSLECICLLIAYKLLFPDKVFLLRGNHEFEYINRTYGFWKEIQDRFESNSADKLFELFNELFGYFPIAALVQNKIFCVHGGLSPHLKSLNDIREIQMPINILTEGLLQDLLWADPQDNLKGFKDNTARECSVLFGEDVVLDFCNKLKIDLIVRGHQVVKDGYSFFANRHLVTVFSVPQYSPDLNNKGAVMQIDKSFVVSFAILNPANSDSDGSNVFNFSFVKD